jgi:tartrate dehydratase alpha subunit/fumarate hydratase class I-like protein
MFPVVMGIGIGGAASGPTWMSERMAFDSQRMTKKQRRAYAAWESKKQEKAENRCPDRHDLSSRDEIS